MQTYLEFRTKLKARLWPAGEPRNLVPGHDAMFQSAMLDLQKWVKCLKEFNVSTWDTADRNWENARTVVTAPYGVIRRVYTVAGGLDRWRDKVFYRSSNIKEIDCWARQLVDATTPVNAGLPVLAYGFKVEESASDWAYGRARQGIWAIDRRRLYVAPWLQSSERLVVEWDGEKQEWQDSDGVDPRFWRSDAEMAVELYVKWRHERMYGDPGYAKEIKVDFDKALADLMYWCRENTRQRQDEICGASGGTIDVGANGSDLTEDDDDSTDPDTTDEDEVLFNAVGDLGDEGDDAEAVAAAIASDNPEVFLALGDLTYNGDYAADFGANYQSFIDDEKLVPVVGNHDFSENGNSFTAFKSYFSDFIRADGALNYEYTIGPVHFLVYNSEDTDGIDEDSAQAEWLMAKLLLSTARWKIVLMHKSPYSSDSTHGSNTDLQLDFSGWGADLVLSAHAHTYERLEVDGLPYIVCGLGGHNIYSFGSPVAGSLVRYNAQYGRLIGEVNCDTLKITFKAVDGTVVDTLTISKE